MPAHNLRFFPGQNDVLHRHDFRIHNAVGHDDRLVDFDFRRLYEFRPQRFFAFQRAAVFAEYALLHDDIAARIDFTVADRTADFDIARCVDVKAVFDVPADDDGTEKFDVSRFDVDAHKLEYGLHCNLPCKEHNLTVGIGDHRHTVGSERNVLSERDRYIFSVFRFGIAPQERFAGLSLFRGNFLCKASAFDDVLYEVQLFKIDLPRRRLRRAQLFRIRFEIVRDVCIPPVLCGSTCSDFVRSFVDGIVDKRFDFIFFKTGDDTLSAKRPLDHRIGNVGAAHRRSRYDDFRFHFVA